MSDASFRPHSNMEVMYYGGGGGPDPMVEALNEYRAATQPKISVPVENYLAAATSQETYGPAMKQYVGKGGHAPSWFTGDFAHDKPFIDTAVAATMSPKDQMIRHESMQKIQIGDERLKAYEEFKREQNRLKEREAADKQAGRESKKSLVPTDKEKGMIDLLLKDREEYSTIDPKSIQAIGATVASRVKHRMATGDRGDFSEMANEEMDDIMHSLIVDKTGGSLFGLLPGKKRFRPDSPEAKADAKPIAMPSSKTDLKTGQIYQTGRGAAKWNGSAFELVKDQ